MVTELTPAFVLHRRRYRDSSLLLELFTLSGGRKPLVARGAASMKSRRRGVLQPFIPLLVAWRGRGAVATLTRVEAAGPVIPLSGKALYSGFYLNELLVRLLPEGEAAPLLFDHYREALAKLPEEARLEENLRTFELRLLDDLGYAPDLEHDLSGNAITATGRYRYHHEAGFSPAAEEDGETVSGATLLALARQRPLEPGQRREARRLMRRLLSAHLGSRPLKSRELFRKMKPGSDSSEGTP